MRVFVIAGEASGDKLGAALMAGLKQLVPDVAFAGIGGSAMQREGLTSLFDMSELSIMGIAEVLPKYRHLKRRISQTADAALDFAADVVVTIDSPDFCLRVAKLVKAARDIRTIHYVAPQVWAWRPHRATHMAKVIDHVLVLLPFEPPFMQAAGMGCDFVGHPVVADAQASAAEAKAFREKHAIGDAPLILALPGSRRGEIARLGPVFGAALAQVVKERSGVRLVLPMAQGIEDAVRQMVSSWPQQPVLLAADDRDGKRAAFRAADAALAASGTVSLELAAAGTPMVIAYDMAWLSRQIIGRMVRVDSICMVNLVSQSHDIPEFVGAKCRPELIAPALLDLLDNPAAQQQAMTKTMQALGAGGEAPGLRAAKAVLNAMGVPAAGLNGGQ